MEPAAAIIAHDTQDRDIASAVRLLPSLTDFAFLLPYVLLFAMLSGSSVLLSDGDTGWHIRTGDWILLHRQVPHVDLFSFTKAGQPWFAWEWAWDVLFSLIHRAWGLAGVAFVSTLILGLVSALLFRFVRRCCGNDIAAFAFTFVAVCGSTVHWLARPHLFSWLLIMVFSHLILSAEEGRLRCLVPLPLLMIVWTNLHGGFFVGILMLGMSAAGRMLNSALRPDATIRGIWNSGKAFLLCAGACLAATFLNPYSWHLHQHVLEYLHDSKLLDNIQEFQSIDFHHGPIIFFETILLLGVAATLWCVQKRKFGAALSILFWAHCALVSERNLPLYLLFATPYAAAMTVDFLGQAKVVAWLKTISAFASDVGAELTPVEQIERFHLTSGAAVALVALLFMAKHPGFEAQFNPKHFPTKALERIEIVKSARVFTSDQWADYLIYKLYPERQVYMDGRSDFYGSEFVKRYQHVMSAQFDWAADLTRYGIDTVVVKPDAPVATVLKSTPGWRTLFDDGSVIIFNTESKHVVETVQNTRANVAAADTNNLRAGVGSQRQALKHSNNQERRTL